MASRKSNSLIMVTLIVIGTLAWLAYQSFEPPTDTLPEIESTSDEDRSPRRKKEAKRDDRPSTNKKNVPEKKVDHISTFEVRNVSRRITKTLSYSGKVFDDNSNDPIVGAVVTLYYHYFPDPRVKLARATTDEDGKFAFTIDELRGRRESELGAATFYLNIKAEGYLPSWEWSGLPIYERGQKFASLSKGPGVLGRLTSPNGEPIDNGDVVLTLRSLVDGKYVETSLNTTEVLFDGSFGLKVDTDELRGTDQEVYLEALCKEGYLLKRQIGLKVDGIVDLGELRLDEYATIEGTLTDLSGWPVANRWFELQALNLDRKSSLEQPGIERATGATDSLGQFRISGLIPGVSYEFGTMGIGPLKHSLKAPVMNAQIKIGCHKLQVKVVDQAGAPIRGAYLELFDVEDMDDPIEAFDWDLASTKDAIASLSIDAGKNYRLEVRLTNGLVEMVYEHPKTIRVESSQSIEVIVPSGQASSAFQISGVLASGRKAKGTWAYLVSPQTGKRVEKLVATDSGFAHASTPPGQWILEIGPGNTSRWDADPELEWTLIHRELITIEQGSLIKRRIKFKVGGNYEFAVRKRHLGIDLDAMPFVITRIEAGKELSRKYKGSAPIGAPDKPGFRSNEDALAPGRYQATFRPLGRKPITQEFEIVAGQMTKLDIVVE